MRGQKSCPTSDSSQLSEASKGLDSPVSEQLDVPQNVWSFHPLSACLISCLAVSLVLFFLSSPSGLVLVFVWEEFVTRSHVAAAWVTYGRQLHYDTPEQDNCVTLAIP